MSNVAKAQHLVLTKLNDFTVQYYMYVIHLVLSLCYGHRSASVSPKIVRFYSARPAAGMMVRFFIIFLDIVRCPVKFRYYLKFHGARKAFGRVNKGKMTSAGHRTGARPAFAHIGRAPDDFCLKFISYDSNGARPGIVWCLTSAGNFKKSLHKSADARPGTGWCFMRRTATSEKRCVLAEDHIAFTYIFNSFRPKT